MKQLALPQLRGSSGHGVWEPIGIRSACRRWSHGWLRLGWCRAAGWRSTG